MINYVKAEVQKSVQVAQHVQVTEGRPFSMDLLIHTQEKTLGPGLLNHVNNLMFIVKVLKKECRV